MKIKRYQISNYIYVKLITFDSNEKEDCVAIGKARIGKDNMQENEDDYGEDGDEKGDEFNGGKTK